MEITHLKTRLIKWTAQGVGAAWLIGFIMACVVPLQQQLMSWLKTGIIPERDLYWVFADVSCAATDWQARGFQGMDLCRIDDVALTDWVGVNQIINSFFDLHLAVVFALLSWFIFLAYYQIVESRTA